MLDAPVRILCELTHFNGFVFTTFEALECGGLFKME
jgi:hypothetical protein